MLARSHASPSRSLRLRVEHPPGSRLIRARCAPAARAEQWITEEVDGKKKYLGQLYANGENCPGFGNRQTKVLFQCKETAKEMELIKEEEPVPCQYVLHVAYAGWCEVKPE